MTKPDITDTILGAMPATRNQIEKLTGLAKTTVFRRVQQLRAAGWCHISGWRPGGHGGFYQPVFRAGAGKDKPCTLQPQSQSETQLRFREKARRTGAWADRAARIRAKYWTKKTSAAGGGWAAALFIAQPAREKRHA